MRAAFSTKPSFFLSRVGFFAVLVALGGCSSEARRVEMPWSAPTASNPTQNTVAWNNVPNNSVEYTGSIAAPGNVKSNNLPPVASNYETPAQKPIVAGEHMVTSGETISSISRRYNVSPGELARLNSFGPQDGLKIGQKLKVPHGGQFAASAKADLPQPAPAKEKKTVAPVVKASPVKAAEASKAKPVEEPVKVARAEAEATASLPPPEPMNAAEFRWPVRGRVVQNYGQQVGGGKNDGINIAVPEGTPVKAAENGVVAYAGSELKGYGKLVLIRHDNDFVTAYAHNSKIEVKRGDKVTRGQVIGKAGQSGDVTQPQVHFEIRKGSSPVDPLTHLSGM